MPEVAISRPLFADILPLIVELRPPPDPASARDVWLSREGRLERVRWRHAPTGAETERAIRNVFLFICADPATNWLRACGVGLDANGFVQTGPQAVAANAAVNGSIREQLPLESNLPGVFAVGDARSGSVKRMGGAIGEGAAVVAQLHSYLAAGHLQQAVQSSA